MLLYRILAMHEPSRSARTLLCDRSTDDFHLSFQTSMSACSVLENKFKIINSIW